MPGSGSSIFTDADGYQASLQDMLDLLALHPRDFSARLTWVDLVNLHLLRAQEHAPRIAYLTLPLEQIFMTFPTRRDSVLIMGGAELRFGDVMFHSRGERLHQRTTEASQWGSISLAPAVLMAFGRTIADQDLAPPPVGRVLRPLPADRQRLLQLHAQAGRIAETDLNRISHREVVRAIEQDLISALVTCLTSGEVQVDSAARHRQAGTLVRFEEALATHPFRLQRIADICGTIGVSERALRASCSRILGMSPGRYQRLRRLKRVHLTLKHANPATVSSTEMKAFYGFVDFHRFVTEYWNVYGEMPPVPPRDIASREI
jgi:AraC-like DNA-binding protein